MNTYSCSQRSIDTAQRHKMAAVLRHTEAVGIIFTLGKKDTLHLLNFECGHSRFGF